MKTNIFEKILIDRDDAQEWIGKKKDIYYHPIITDRNNKDGGMVK